MLKKIGNASKFVVSILGATATSFQTYYGAEPRWVPIITSALTAIAVYLVPNSNAL